MPPGPAISLTVPRATRRSISSWNARSCPWQKPTPYQASSSFPASMYGIPVAVAPDGDCRFRAGHFDLPGCGRQPPAESQPEEPWRDVHVCPQRTMRWARRGGSTSGMGSSLMLKMRSKSALARHRSCLPNFRRDPLGLHRRDPAVFDSAGDDVLEVAQVRRHVQGEAVCRDPPADPHAYGGYLCTACPDAGGVALRFRGDAEVRQCLYEKPLQRSHVLQGPHTEPPKVHYGVADQLSGPVIRDLAAPVYVMHLHA